MRRSFSSGVLGCLAALVLAGSVRASEYPLPVESFPDYSGVSYEGAHEGVAGDAGLVAYHPRFWAEIDYLLLWARAAKTPALLSTGPNTAIGPGGVPGTLGIPGTAVLIGGDVDNDPNSGARAVLGAWIDDECKYGIEASGFYLAERGVDQAEGSRGTIGSRALAVPFFNDAIGMESSAAVAFDRPIAALAGQAELSVSHRAWGVEGLALCCLHEKRGYRLDLLGGYRYLNIEETLDYNTSSGNVGEADTFLTRDSFRCNNEFHGAQIGLRNQIYSGRVFFRGTTKLALGNMRSSTRIDGSLVTNDFPELGGQTQTFQGGYFAQPTNIGTYSRSRFVVVPEASAGLGLHLCPWLRVSVTYTFLYVSSVLRPGDQIDRTINPTQSPALTGNPATTLNGAARPIYPASGSDYWLQGLSIGMEMRF